MNVRILIDAIVRQTMVLIAQLATSGGLRAPLAHVAGQAFLELAKELESQGVPKKVSADMFGMALRTYQRRTQRLSQSKTFGGRSLWEAVFEYVEEKGVITRDQILRRFRHDDEPSLRGVLRDLTESGLLFASGTGRGAGYRLATGDEIGALRRTGDRLGLEAFIWSLVYRDGETSLDELAGRCAVPRADLEQALEALIDAGRIERRGDVFIAQKLVLGLENPAGWEAAVLDQFSALVQTITQKLARDQRASLTDEVGGSTYHFELWRGHPLEREVLGELRRFRERLSALRDKIDRYNAEQTDHPAWVRVVAYYGQSVTEEDENGLEADENREA